jgi:multiple RNA-binding domain-containing protein 1
LIDKNNPKLLEFLGLHQKVKKWENDDVMAKVDDEEEEGEEGKKRKHKEDETNGKKKKKAKTDKEKEKEEDKSNGKSKIALDALKVTKEDISNDKILQQEFGESDDEYEDLPDPTSQKLYVCDAEEEKELEEASGDVPMDDDEEDDMDYIKSKMIDAKKDDESSDAVSDGATSDSDSSEEDSEPKSKVREKGKITKKVIDESETGRLFVRNLPFTITEEELQALFSKYGMVSEVHIPHDKESNRSKGIALVAYLVPTDATKAMKALDGSNFQGRVLHVLPGEV